MPPHAHAHMKDDAVLWAATDTDDDGEVIVAEPVEIKVRWEVGRTEGLDPQGNTIALEGIVACTRDIPLMSIMYKGTLTDFLGSGSAGDDTELMQVGTYIEATDVKGRVKRRELGLVRWKDRLPEIES